MKKPRPIKAIGRKRRTLCWTLLTLGLLVAAVWAASGLWHFRSNVGYATLIVDSGTVDTIVPQIQAGAPLLAVEAPKGSVAVGIRSGRIRVPYNDGQTLTRTELFEHRRWIGPQNHDQLTIRLWPIPLLLWTPAALLLRSGILARRRAVKGMCAKCGYSLAGLGVDAKCPECGKGAVAS